MKTEGIIYYNRGTKVLVRIVTSIFSLRETGWGGGVSLLHEGDLPAWVLACCNKLDVSLKQIPGNGQRNALSQKASLWRYSPYDVTMFIDADTVVCRGDRVPEFMDIIRQHSFVATRFTNWCSDGPRISRRIRAWSEVVSSKYITDAVAHGPAVNTGVFGFQKGVSLLAEWERIVLRAAGTPADSRVLDEIGCQILLPQHPSTVVSEEWNRSVTYGLSNEPMIYHFHGGKHLLTSRKECDVWREAYWRARAGLPMTDQPSDDRNLTKYLKENPVPAGQPRPDLTVCIAADMRYAPKLTRHFLLWKKTQNLGCQKFLCFCVNSDPNHPAYATLRENGVRLVRYDAPNVSPREAAFSAFVFGVVEHVTTPYWMKLDGDSTPRGPFQWPDYTNHTITADPWHYTRVKGDPGATEHWLNTLDRYFGGKALFPPIHKDQRHRHKRCRSYCWIEKLEFTKELAAKCGDRLPVPSHDTTAWVYATKTGRSINRHGFRKYITA